MVCSEGVDPWLCGGLFSVLLLNSAASWGARVALGGRSLAYVPGVSVFTLYPVLFLGGCKFLWVVALTVVAAKYCFCVCSWFLHCIDCRAFVMLLNGSIVHCVWLVLPLYCTCSLHGTNRFINRSYITYCYSTTISVL